MSELLDAVDALTKPRTTRIIQPIYENRQEHDMNELLEAVTQLTQPHKKTIHTVDGFEIHERASLFEQLHDAVFGGMEKTGGSGTKARLPISDAAVDLHELIDQQVAEAWAAATGNIPRVMTPTQMLVEWATLVDPAAVVVVTHKEQHEKWDPARSRNVPFVVRIREEWEPAKLARRWVSLIEDFLNPDRTVGIKAPCIQCGARTVPRNRDGEWVVSDALVFRRHPETGQTLDARCLQCGVVWMPHQFEYLATALGINVETVKESMSEPGEKVET